MCQFTEWVETTLNKLSSACASLREIVRAYFRPGTVLLTGNHYISSIIAQNHNLKVSIYSQCNTVQFYTSLYLSTVLHCRFGTYCWNGTNNTLTFCNHANNLKIHCIYINKWGKKAPELYNVFIWKKKKKRTLFKNLQYRWQKC